MSLRIQTKPNNLRIFVKILQVLLIKHLIAIPFYPIQMPLDNVKAITNNPLQPRGLTLKPNVHHTDLKPVHLGELHLATNKTQ